MLISLHHYTSARYLLTAEWTAAVLGSAFAGNLSDNLCATDSKLPLYWTACADLNAPTTTMIELSVFISMGLGMGLVWPLLVDELCSAAITLTVLGTMFYAVGITFYLLGEYKPIYHVIWHVFVVVAATLHWFAVYFFVVQTNLMHSPTKTVVTEMIETVSAAAASASASFSAATGT